jgi:hypothetical protein
MPFGSLWLQVVIAAVVVFVASALMHMVLRYHKNDYRKFPDEEALRAVLGKSDLAPGLYPTPYCSDMKQMKDPAMLAKFEKGPVAHVVVLPKGQPNMGKHLSLWFGYAFLVSFVAAYMARHALHPGGADQAFAALRITGAAAFTAYGLPEISSSIWKGQPWSNTFKFMIDAAVYSILTGLVFNLMWPAA